MGLTLMPLTERDMPELIDAPAAFALPHALTVAEGACAPAFFCGRALTKMLQRIGYVRDGETIDPDDGLVWRWVHAKA